MATMTETMTDTELQRMVHDELKWEPSINPAHIGVSVKDGVVTLSGHVITYAQKYAAEKAAKRVDGVRAVANEIEVKLLEGAGRSEEDLARAALEALESHIFVPADDIRVAVRDGWITLEGEVRWQFQRNAAEKAVRYLPGIKGVINQIKIKPKVAPAEVKKQIEEAFKRSAEIDAENIKITANEGHVVLTGIVHSWAEREEATRQVWSAPGVKSVENRIVVQS